MKNNDLTRYDGNVAVNANEVLKETAFIYIKEALDAQRFEECAELIRNAKEFGATPAEIKALLTGYNRGYSVNRNNNEANTKKGQPRF